MNPLIISNRSKIDNLLNKYRAADDDNLKKDIARYACVLVSGYIEESLRVIISDYAKGKSAPIISKFVDSKVNKVTNCHFNKIVEILKLFHPPWADKFCEEVGQREIIENQFKDIVDSVVATRHQIAHGKNTGISIRIITDYYDCIKIVIEILDEAIA